MKFLHRWFYLIILMLLIVSMESPAVARDYSYMDDHVSSDTEQMTLPAETNPMGSQANIIWGSIILEKSVKPAASVKCTESSILYKTF